jgi:hypothetical protein
MLKQTCELSDVGIEKNKILLQHFIMDGTWITYYGP